MTCCLVFPADALRRMREHGEDARTIVGSDCFLRFTVTLLICVTCATTHMTGEPRGAPSADEISGLVAAAATRPSWAAADTSGDAANFVATRNARLPGRLPTLVDQSRFLAAPHPDAWERVVEQLLSSRDHVERRAQHGLDLARYADWNGFFDDHTRDIWPYRDWAIESIHNHMPFDQFMIEQLARIGF